MSRRSTRRAAARSARTSRNPLTVGRSSVFGGQRVGQSLYRRWQFRRQLRLEPLEERRLLAITVTTLDDSIDFNDGVTSLREAIFAANTVPGADTIEFAPALTESGPATIVLTQGELKITDSLTINGPGADLLAIDASGNDPTPEVNNGDGSRIFNTTPRSAFSSATPPSLNVNGLSFTGGDVRGSGGAILSAGEIRALACVFRDNASLGSGGAVIIGTPTSLDIDMIGRTTFVDCQFSENVARHGNGGALAVLGDSFEPGEFFVSGCIFNGNNAGRDGGGVFIFGRTTNAEVQGSLFQSNSAENGGGIYAATQGSVRIVDSSILKNITTVGGGGISSGNSSTIENSLIAGNIAGKYGGGLNVGGDTLIVDCTISNNIARIGVSWDATGGGGITSSGNLIVRHSTIVGNKVAILGDGAYAAGGGIAGWGGAILRWTIQSSPVIRMAFLRCLTIWQERRCYATHCWDQTVARRSPMEVET